MIDAVTRLVQEAGELLLRHFNRLSAADISVKERGGLVTSADTESEKLLIEGLRRIAPGSGFLAEESGEEPAPGGRWIIDPLDGTSNFANGIPWFCISVAYEERAGAGDRAITLGVIYNPLSRDLYCAERGKGATLNGTPLRVSTKSAMPQSMLATGFYYHKGPQLTEAMRLFAEMQEQVLGVRRFGAAALDLALLAAGRFDGFWEVGLAPWDVAAGVLLIEEAGGKLTDYRGGPHSLYKKETVASNGVLHDALLRTIKATPRSSSSASF